MSNLPLLPDAWASVRTYRSPRFGYHWFGVSDRSLSRRLESLCGTPNAKRVLDVLENLPRRDLKQLETIAGVNADQAEAAFRRVFVFNLTLPTGFLFGFLQIYPALTSGVAADFGDQPSRLFVIGLIALLILATVFFAFLRSKDARDLADLVTLAKARADRLDEAA